MPDVEYSVESIGYIAATTAAMLWACSTMLYGRAGRTLAPMPLNCIKGVFTTMLFVATLRVVGTDFFGQLRELDQWRLTYLAISGIIGIAVGDSFYFACVNTIGARRVALLSLLATPLVVIGGALTLGERLSPPAWGGILLTIAGVAWVVFERTEHDKAPPADALEPVGRVPTGFAVAATKRGTGALGMGIIFGLSAAVCQAGGALLNRSAVRDLDFDLDPLVTALWRLGMATIALIPVVLIFRGKGRKVRGKPTMTTWIIVAGAAIMGTYGGIWLQQIAFQNAPAGPAQTLLSTTPIWVLPLAMLAGERVTWRAVSGAVVGVGGVALLVASDWLWIRIGG